MGWGRGTLFLRLASSQEGPFSAPPLCSERPIPGGYRGDCGVGVPFSLHLPPAAPGAHLASLARDPSCRQDPSCRRWLAGQGPRRKAHGAEKECCGPCFSERLYWAHLPLWSSLCPPPRVAGPGEPPISGSDTFLASIQTDQTPGPGCPMCSLRLTALGSPLLLTRTSPDIAHPPGSCPPTPRHQGPLSQAPSPCQPPAGQPPLPLPIL